MFIYDWPKQHIMVYVILEEFVKAHRDDGSVWEREREKNPYWWHKLPQAGYI